MHEIEPLPITPPPPKGYFSIAPVQWQSDIIPDLLFTLSSQILGPTELIKKKSRSRKWLGYSFANPCVFAQLWFLVSEVIYSGIEL